jgi:hypothetical protein
MIGRNDPCPCGSGKKYKHCCRASDAGVISLDRERTQREARVLAAQASTWQAEVLPLPINITQEQDARPVAVLIIASGFVLHPDIRARVGGETADVVTALEHGIVNAAREVGSYPPTIHVRHDEVAHLLRPRLSSRGIEVHKVDALPDLQDAAASLIDHLGGVAHWPPACSVDTWNAWGLRHGLVARLFHAAAAYWRAAPWKVVENDQAPLVSLADGGTWTACVLGNAGEEFGLGLYSDPADFERTLAATGPERAFANARGRIYSLTFDPLKQVPKLMPGEARRHGWEVADARAFPILCTINTPGGGVSESDARDLIRILEILPGFVADNRTALLREQRTGHPCRLEWSDAASGAAVVYRGALIPRETANNAELADEDPFRTNLRSAVTETIAALPPDTGDDDALRAINQRLQQVSAQYNDRPQADLGGLSPAQLQQLLSADWSDSRGVLQLRRNLPFERVRRAPVLHNARAILALADERGGLASTQHGFLRTALVRELRGRLSLGQGIHIDDGQQIERVTERDVWPLHLVRILTQLAGLIVHRKGMFLLTAEGRELLGVDRAGELYATLFMTCYRRFDLSYLSSFGPAWPELQYQVAFTLYSLAGLASSWSTSDQLMPKAVLPYALEQAPRESSPRLPGLLFERRVLETLRDFALLEDRHEPQRNQTGTRYRKTLLYDDFLGFSLIEPAKPSPLVQQ